MGRGRTWSSISTASRSRTAPATGSGWPYHPGLCRCLCNRHVPLELPSITQTLRMRSATGRAFEKDAWAAGTGADPAAGAGCGAGSRGFPWRGRCEQLVVGAGPSGPTRPGGPARPRPTARHTAVVHDRVVPLAEQGRVVEVATRRHLPSERGDARRSHSEGHLAPGIGAAAVAEPQPLGLGG